MIFLLALIGGFARAETVLRRGNHDEPETLDPHKSDGSQEYWIQSDLFEGLTRIDGHGRIVPGVAEKWEVTPDGLTWIFHLRADLKWSDGSPLTADDFVWSFRRVLDPKTAASYASVLYPIAKAKEINEGTEKDFTKLGVTAPDARTVQFKLVQPTAYLPGVLTLGVGFPLPRKAIEAYGDEWTRPGKIISNGAFVMQEWTPQLDIKLKRNPNYYAPDGVKLDGVVWSVNEQDETAIKRYRAGELDISRVPTKQVAGLKTELPGHLHISTLLQTRYLIVNTQRPPLNDARLRLAMALLLDRETIAEKIDPHGEKPAYGLIPPGFDGYMQQPPDWIETARAERVERAKKLLEEAGYGPSNPLKIEVVYPSGEDVKRILTATAGVWKPLGIALTPVPEENQIVLSQARQHEFQMAYFDWLADYPDPWTFLSCFRSDAGGLNASDYRNPEFDALLDEAVATVEPARRLQVLERAEKLISRDFPVIPITFDALPSLISPKIKGYFDNPLHNHPSQEMSLEP
jgi:oligopeptide transport system substrate-binding protein